MWLTSLQYVPIALETYSKVLHLMTEITELLLQLEESYPNVHWMVGWHSKLLWCLPEVMDLNLVPRYLMQAKKRLEHDDWDNDKGNLENKKENIKSFILFNNRSTALPHTDSSYQVNFWKYRLLHEEGRITRLNTPTGTAPTHRILVHHCGY